MNIAIVAPSPVPFIMGGAENLWLGLQRFINENTNHHCELFKIPTLEANFEQLINSYAQFCRLDYSTFDCVISGKYPGWMVEHRNHKVYMLHALRGLYDTYHLTGQPSSFSVTENASRIVSAMDELVSREKVSNSDILRFLDLVNDHMTNAVSDSILSRFPGPFTRKVVHCLDAIALRPNRISGYAAISQTVTRRQYFPEGAQVDVLYPPPRLEGFKCRGDDYLFTASRLDGPKRIGLLIDAMKHVKSDIRLYIGGTGPDEHRLNELAQDDSRISFLGHLNDAELLDCYADALAVPFVPYDEDYGLVTIEAMKSGKPVITCTDSGGVTEFVTNGETGLVVAPEARELGAAIDYLVSHRDEAREMGRRAERKVSMINWNNVARKLIGEQYFNGKSTSVKLSSLRSKRRMVVAVTFPIFPPRGGGQSRIFHLYKELAKSYEISILSLGSEGDSLDREIFPGLREIRVPKTPQHQALENNYSQRVGWAPVTDIVAARLMDKTPEYKQRLIEASEGAHIVVASHPYLVTLLLECVPNAELWFEAHNVEAKLKQLILPSSEASHELLGMVREDESKAWLNAKCVFACTKGDLDELKRLYGPTKARLSIIPNGYSPDEVRFIDSTVKAAMKKKLGITGIPSVVFIGSWHGPNLEAVERVIEIAVTLPGVVFLIIGSAGLKFQDMSLPENIRLLGVLDEKEKQVVLAVSDLAINPMTSGSGSNLKMLDYLASGVVVLSTPFGARGINLVPGTHFISAEISQFRKEIYKFFVEADESSHYGLAVNAASYVVENYSWPVIAKAFLSGQIESITDW